jgi:excinuclease ABC subunit A
LISLRDLGNTVIVVEHDEDIMKAADMIIDIGPEAGSLVEKLLKVLLMKF